MGYNYTRGRNYRRSYPVNNDPVESKVVPEKCKPVKNHNHEFLSSTDYSEDEKGVIHNHRTAGITGPPIKEGESHVHKIEAFTDTFLKHFHGLCETTGPAISISEGKHIHLICGETSVNDKHNHDYYFTTLVEDPSNTPCEEDC